eukprot:12992739-Alexandrium_andersonii.AAC.1
MKALCFVNTSTATSSRPLPSKGLRTQVPISEFQKYAKSFEYLAGSSSSAVLFGASGFGSSAAG